MESLAFWFPARLTDAAPTLALAVLVKGSALLLVAGLISGRLRSAAQRHLVWCLGLAGQLLLLILVVLVPPMPVAVPSWPDIDRLGETAPASVPAAIGRTESPPGTVGAANGREDAANVAVGGAAPGEWAGRGFGWVAVAFAWAAGTSLLIISLLRTTLRRNRLLGHAVPATTSRWRTLLAENAALLGLTRPPRLLIGLPGAVPMTWGTRRPVVLLPCDIVDWPSERCRSVLLHELSHVRRCDHLAQRLAQVTRALYWPNPLVWWAARRLAIESEQACDDLALGAGARPSRYAAHLLAAARALRPTRAGACRPEAGVGMAPTSQLASRITNILDETRSRTPLDGRRFLVAVLATAAIVIPVAAAVPAASVQEAPKSLPAPTVPGIVPKSASPPTPAPPTPPVAAPPESASLASQAEPGPQSVARGAPPRPSSSTLPAEPLEAARAVEAPSVIPMRLLPVNAPFVSSTPEAPEPPSHDGDAASEPVGFDALLPPDTEGVQGGAVLPLEVAPTSRFSRAFVFRRDGEPVAELRASRRKPRATLTVGKLNYDLLREGRLRGDFVLAREGSILARAQKPSVIRRSYELKRGDSTFSLHPASVMKRRFVLARGERVLGAIEPAVWHSGHARIALPEAWPLELQAFAFWLAQLSWEQDRDNLLAATLSTFSTPR